MDPKVIASTCVATQARRAARHLSRIYDDALRPHGIKVSQFSILVAAALSDGTATITELADELGLERTTLSRNLQPLERRGLIAIGPETQHRARSVTLTKVGRDLIETASPAWAEAQKRATAALDDRTQVAMSSLKTLSRIP